MTDWKDKEIERLRDALQEISLVSAGGPHASAEDGLRRVWQALDRARRMADAAIEECHD